MGRSEPELGAAGWITGEDSTLLLEHVLWALFFNKKWFLGIQFYG